MIGTSYDNIIGLEYKGPARHPRMSMHDRAAQFAPFAALTGYDEVITETGRITGSKAELDERQMEELNKAMAAIRERLREHPEVMVTFFQKDGRKAGGAYYRTQGHVRNIDDGYRMLVLAEGPSIPLDDLFSMTLI
ncbi:MAG: hypothetical protein J5520_00155 [Bacteroidales bacterium]|nr:hypothetical protein [Bacteroidales bacterium]